MHTTIAIRDKGLIDKLRIVKKNDGISMEKQVEKALFIYFSNRENKENQEN